MAKTLIFSIFLFAIPVLISFCLSAEFFSNTEVQIDASSEYVLDNLENLEPLELESSKSFIELSSEDILDPSSSKLFLFSFTFSIPESLKEGQTVKFFTKYDAKNKPYNGWGLRLRKAAGVIRPEVYWQGLESNSGWYTFAEIKPKNKNLHSLTFVADKEKSISLYFKDLSAENSAKYLGGFSVNNIGSVKSEGNLRFLYPVSASKDERIIIFDFLIANLNSLDFNKGIEFFQKLVNESLYKKLPYDDIALWVDARGRDRSKFARKLLE